MSFSLLTQTCFLDLSIYLCSSIFVFVMLDCLCFNRFCICISPNRLYIFCGRFSRFWFISQPTDWQGKWPTLCRVGRQMLTKSISQSISVLPIGNNNSGTSYCPVCHRRHVLHAGSALRPVTDQNWPELTVAVSPDEMQIQSGSGWKLTSLTAPRYNMCQRGAMPRRRQHCCCCCCCSRNYFVTHAITVDPAICNKRRFTAEIVQQKIDRVIDRNNDLQTTKREFGLSRITRSWSDIATCYRNQWRIY